MHTLQVNVHRCSDILDLKVTDSQIDEGVIRDCETRSVYYELCIKSRLVFINFSTKDREREGEKNYAFTDAILELTTKCIVLSPFERIFSFDRRRMFPSLQLNISGLQNYLHYYVVVEMTPASNRRHKYSGNAGHDDVNGNKDGNRGGWTTAGPAEPQPHLDRRIYLHPDGPALGAHWMQHIVSFSKLKVTNNAAGHRNNVRIREPFMFKLILCVLTFIFLSTKTGQIVHFVIRTR